MDPVDHGIQDDVASGQPFAADLVLEQESEPVPELAFAPPPSLVQGYPSAPDPSQPYGAEYLGGYAHGQIHSAHSAQYDATSAQDYAQPQYQAYSDLPAQIPPDHGYPAPNGYVPLQPLQEDGVGVGVGVGAFRLLEAPTSTGGTISPSALLNEPVPPAQDVQFQGAEGGLGGDNTHLPTSTGLSPSQPNLHASSNSVSSQVSTFNSTSASTPASTFNSTASTAVEARERQDIQDLEGPYIPSDGVLVRFRHCPALRPPSRTVPIKGGLNERRASRTNLVSHLKYWRRKVTVGTVQPPPSKPKASKPVKPAAVRRPAGNSAEMSGSSTEDNDTDSSNDDAHDTAKLSPLPSVRPADPVEGMRYDTIKILWQAPQKRLARDEITSAVTDFSALIKAAKDRWDAIEKDEASKAASAEAIKSSFEHERRMIGVCVSAAIDFGHPTIINHLGANQLFLLFLTKVLRDRIKDEDFTGNLVLDVLDLMSRVNPPATVLEQLKFSKLAARLSKRGNQRTRDLVEKVVKTIAPAAQPQPDAQKESKAENQAPAKAAGLGSSETRQTAVQGARGLAAQAASKAVKRLGDNDVGQSQALKRQAPTAGTASTASSTADTRVLGKPGQLSRPTASTAKSAATVPTQSGAVKSKNIHVTAKPTGFFDGLNAVSKAKSAIATKGAAASSSSAAKKAVSPTVVPSAESANESTDEPARPTKRPFSVISTLDDLQRSKEADLEAESATKILHETEEEKKKRLRKEERRKLRVIFRPEESLEQIRYITHVHDEEAGRTTNSLRDAGDTVQEGRTFKANRGVALGDDEEEEWRPPPLINFDDLDPAVRARNYITRGGTKLPHSPEKIKQDEREKTIPMVVYTSLSDIPDSPASPIPEEEPEYTPPILLGPPPSWIYESDLVKRAEGREREKALRDAQRLQAPPPVEEERLPDPAVTAYLDDLFANLYESIANSTSAEPARPSPAPVSAPTTAPTTEPTTVPTTVPTTAPATASTAVATTAPTTAPTAVATTAPTTVPIIAPTTVATTVPTTVPSIAPTVATASSTATAPTPTSLADGPPRYGMFVLDEEWLEAVFEKYAEPGTPLAARREARAAAAAAAAQGAPAAAPELDVQTVLANLAILYPQAQLQAQAPVPTPTPSVSPETNTQLQQALAQLAQTNTASTQNVAYQPQPASAGPWESQTTSQHVAYPVQPATSYNNAPTPWPNLSYQPQPATSSSNQPPSQSVAYQPQPATSYNNPTPWQNLSYQAQPATAYNNQASSQSMAYPPQPASSFNNQGTSQGVMYQPQQPARPYESTAAPPSTDNPSVPPSEYERNLAALQGIMQPYQQSQYQPAIGNMEWARRTMQRDYGTSEERSHRRQQHRRNSNNNNNINNDDGRGSNNTMQRTSSGGGGGGDHRGGSERDYRYAGREQGGGVGGGGDRERDRDQPRYSGRDQGAGGGGGGNRRGYNNNFKQKPCKYFMDKGFCRRGDACGYKH